MTCGREAWTITKDMEKKLDACENRWLRRTGVGMSWVNPIVRSQKCDQMASKN